MKIDKNYEGLINEGWRYRIDGNITTTENIEIDLDMGLYVTGSIKAGGSIEAGRSIKAGGSIEAGRSIKAGWSIEAGEFIYTGESYGIVAGLSITCKTTLSCGLRLFAGICNWRETTDEDKTVTCGKLVKGTIEYGILKETGLPDEADNDDKTEEAMKLLKEKGYRIVKL